MPVDMSVPPDMPDPDVPVCEPIDDVEPDDMVELPVWVGVVVCPTAEKIVPATKASESTRLNFGWLNIT